MKKQTRKSAVASLGALALLSSCSNTSHLVLFQHSNLGLNTAVNPANQDIHIRVGLRREFGAIVPKYIEKSSGDKKAASAYFGSRVRITHPWRVPEVAEIMATGRAATLAAQADNALDFADSNGDGEENDEG